MSRTATSLPTVTGRSATTQPLPVACTACMDSRLCWICEGRGQVVTRTGRGRDRYAPCPRCAGFRGCPACAAGEDALPTWRGRSRK